MKLLLAFLFSFAAVTAQAQVVTPKDKLGYDQDAPTLADANRYGVTLTIDTVPPTVPQVKTGTNKVCTGTTSPFLCTVDWPANTPGNYTITGVATDGPLTSDPSVPFGFVFGIVPSAPRNLRNVKGK